MARRNKREPARAGTFRPAAPADAHDVVFMFAAAARAVCALPEALAEISRTLAQVNSHLMPPEQMAADECQRLWRFFVAAAAADKPGLRQEAGRALVRDLDVLGQRLDLAPLLSWDRIPEAVDDPKAAALEQEDEASESESGDALTTVRRRAKRKLGKKKHLPLVEIVELVSALKPEERQHVYGAMIGQGMLGRSEAVLVDQRLLKGDRVRAEEEALVDVLNKLGTWLTA
jgi:hypothetical protein